MRIGVLSDSHGRKELAKDVVNSMGTIDLLLHAGDHYDDALYLSRVFSFPVYGVKGNCDYSGPKEEIVQAGEISILLIHGHQYGVKQSLDRLSYRAEESAVKIVVFGHTHTPEIEWVNGILLFNPGSIIRPRGMFSHATYGIIELEKNKIKPYLKEVTKSG